MADWIPCSQQQPTKSGDYLVTMKLVTIYPIEVCYFDGTSWDKGNYEAVLAWQPLPEAYKVR